MYESERPVSSMLRGRGGSWGPAGALLSLSLTEVSGCIGSSSRRRISEGLASIAQGRWRRNGQKRICLLTTQTFSFTISRTLNNMPGVSPNKRQQILTVAAELD